MKILLTGANGYVSRRLLPELLLLGHDVVCAVRDKNRLGIDDEMLQKISIWEVDFTKPYEETTILKDVDIAYYMIHSMSTSIGDFDELEKSSAKNFNTYLEHSSIKQVIYLSGIVNNNSLSKHLQSRLNVEQILFSGKYNLTVLRAGIIVGSGSSSFEIIRDLCEKLPLMIAPKWVLTRTHPIAIRDVLKYLIGVIENPKTFNKSFDVAGPNILTYKQLMEQYAEVRNLNLKVYNFPLMTPRLSSYWLFFVTSTSYYLAVNLINSLKVEVIAKDSEIKKIIPFEGTTYKEAIRLAFDKIEQNSVISSWKDSLTSSRLNQPLSNYIQIPKYGCFKDKKRIKITNTEQTLENIWSIGGERGWYYATWIWNIRGILDKAFGGIGIRRGRTHPTQLDNGDALDFWRVLLADKENKRLLLFAEMKVPGEAWLEFRIDSTNTLHQTATFRPHGIWGRLYWYAMLPFHFFIFDGMIKNINKFKTTPK
jgi:uncharacterized protein YbjT (DUF2867 family)